MCYDLLEGEQPSAQLDVELGYLEEERVRVKIGELERVRVKYWGAGEG